MSEPTPEETVPEETPVQEPTPEPEVPTMEGFVFVPDGENRTDTAILLLRQALGYEVPLREIKATEGGFFISQRLADLISAESSKAPTDSSGNRAEKEHSEEENP